MPRSHVPQRRAFRFLRERFQSQQPFTIEEFKQATGWRNPSLHTYWSKHFKDLLEKVGPTTFRVTETFATHATWRRFKTIASQARRLIAEYREVRYNAVVAYEFYTPLKHETALRNTLDSLFLPRCHRGPIARGGFRRAAPRLFATA
jgi:hypothetical protein